MTPSRRRPTRCSRTCRPGAGRPCSTAATGTCARPTGIGGVEIVGVDPTDPVTAGFVSLLDGREPRTENEIAVTRAAADRLGTEIGGTVTTADRKRTLSVVGVVEFPDDLGETDRRTAGSAPATGVLVRGHPDGTGLDRGPPPQRARHRRAVPRGDARPAGVARGGAGALARRLDRAGEDGGDRRRPRPPRGHPARRAGVRDRRQAAPPRPRAGGRERRHARSTCAGSCSPTAWWSASPGRSSASRSASSSRSPPGPSSRSTW